MTTTSWVDLVLGREDGSKQAEAGECVASDPGIDGFDDQRKPMRERRLESKDYRTKKRRKSLQIGFVQAKRADRWAVRRHQDWLMYAIYEHLFDTARFRGRYRGTALLFLWEIAEDLNVNVATVSRKLRKLEKLDFIQFGRSKSDCFPNTFYISSYDVNPESTDNIPHGGQK
jgi:hypothetical protein